MLKRFSLWTIVLWVFVLSGFALIASGCASSKYGKEVHEMGIVCPYCGVSLMARCSAILADGTYDCVCVKCKREVKFRAGKVLKRDVWTMESGK